MRLEALIFEPANNTDYSANDVSDPIVHIGTATKVQLDELHHAAEGACPYKYGRQCKAASPRKGKG